MSASFASILDRPATDIERPKPLPVGTYLCLIQQNVEWDKSKEKQTPFVRFTLKVLQPQDDVDAEELASVKNVTEKTLRITFYLTEDALFRLADKDGTGFLDHCGTDPTLSIRQRIADAPGNQILASVRHRPSQDGTQIYAEAASTAKP